MMRGEIGSPEVPMIVEPGVDQEDYRQFLLDAKARATTDITLEDSATFEPDQEYKSE